MTPGRNTNLDALRAIAILLVIGRHYNYIRYWHAIGWCGVDLFFVLSGFLIGGLLFAGYKQHGRIDISRFYIRRGLKIWPAFYAMILATVVIHFLLPGSSRPIDGIWPELIMVQSYIPGVWGHTWSLAVEEHFYLILPVVLLLVSRRGGDRPFAAIPYLFGAIAIFSLACRFAVGWHDTTDNYQAYLYPTHLRIDGLLFGVLLSYYHHFEPRTFQRIAASRITWIAVAAALVLLFRLPPESRHMHTWGLTVLWLAAGGLVAKMVAFEGPAPVRVVSGLLARIGVYSYSIYLWHLFYKDILRPMHPTSTLPWFLCFGVGSIVVGILASKLIEIPVLHFRDRVFPSQSPAMTRKVA